MLALSCYIALLLFGFYVGVVSTTLPAIKLYFAISYSETGFIWLFAIIPSLFNNLVSAHFIRRRGAKYVFVISMVVFAISLLGRAFAPSYILFVLFGVLGSFFIAGISLSINLIISSIYPDKKERKLNLLHTFFGVGAIISPYISAIFIKRYGWQIPYILNAVFYILLAIFVSFVKVVDVKDDIKEGSVKAYISMFKGEKVVRILSFMIMFYVAIEVSISGWLVMYIENGFGYLNSYASVFLTLFFLMLTMGRLLASMIIHRFNIANLIQLFVFVIMFILVFGGVFHIFLLIAVSGLFLAIFYPIITMWAVDYYKGREALALGIIYTFASIGATLLQFAVAGFVDIFGIRYFLIITIIFLIFFIVLVYRGKDYIYGKIRA